MNVSSLWPPQRSGKLVIDRLRHTRAEVAADIYQRRHAGVPWMPQSAVEILEDMLKPTDRCFEWGSGASTSWFGERTASIRAVEHDPVWYERTRRGLAAKGVDVESVKLLSLEPREHPAQTPYVRAIDEFGDGELDMCFIDGEHRPTCAIESVAKLRSGGLLVVDDAQSFLDHPSIGPYSRDGQGPLDADWGKVAELVRDWRLIWTGDGYSDAAIWIKP
jgi:predicted O-methyltransferase YrrM